MTVEGNPGKTVEEVEDIAQRSISFILEGLS